MSSANLILLSRLKYEYSLIESKKAEFALFTARQKQFEEGDKASKMLARYIKIKELACVIPAIREPNGQLHSDTMVYNIFKSIYMDSYSSELVVDNEEINPFLAKLNLPSLSEEQQKKLDDPITVNEIIDVIQKLPNGKAPGLDGFTDEFFKLYMNEVSPLLLEMYTESLRVGSLPPTLNEALITLILKKTRTLLSVRAIGQYH